MKSLSTHLPSAPRSARSSGRVLRFLAALGCLSSACLHAAPGNPAEDVERLISSVNFGKPPTLWLSVDPKVNEGSGPKVWSASSGGQLDARGLDPWQRPAAAFGPFADATGGVALAGSTAQSPINPQAGTVLMFFRPGEKTMPPALLFSNADWGSPNYFSLRINNVAGEWSLTLGISDQGIPSKAKQVNFATATPGVWTFVAVTWKQTGDVCQLRYWAGDLKGGQLSSGQTSAPALSAAPASFLIGGRRADSIATPAHSALTFADGLYSNFAIYDAVLSEEAVTRIYTAACKH